MLKAPVQVSEEELIRQRMAIDEARKIVADMSADALRPLTASVVTFGCQMNTKHEITKKPQPRGFLILCPHNQTSTGGSSGGTRTKRSRSPFLNVTAQTRPPSMSIREIIKFTKSFNTDGSTAAASAG